MYNDQYSPLNTASRSVSTSKKFPDFEKGIVLKEVPISSIVGKAIDKATMSQSEAKSKLQYNCGAPRKST